MVNTNIFFLSGMCLKNFQIFVTNHFDEDKLEDERFELCHRQMEGLSSGERFFVRCLKSIKGRHVVIIAPGNMPLILCEVEVYETTAWGKFLLLFANDFEKLFLILFFFLKQLRFYFVKK